MGKRNAARTISSLVVALFVALCAASCGSSNGSTFDGGIGTQLLDATFYGDGGGTVLRSPTGDATTGQGSCIPRTCATLGFTCGQNADGCGNLTPSCGTCTAPEFCGGGGMSQCGLGVSSDGGPIAVASDGGPISSCVPFTCAGQGFDCGAAGDGCGSTIQCGTGTTCPGTEYCGGGGPNKCGGAMVTLADGGTVSPCVPTSCADQGANCGMSGDGCGNILDCTIGNPPCVSPQICGGAGTSKCGTPQSTGDAGLVSPCVPTSCAAQGINCGMSGDGCGNVLDCTVGNPPCVLPQTCGGGGPGKCGGGTGTLPDGAPICVPKPCTAGCGQTTDGCSGIAQCPVTCTLPDTCGGSGTAFQCGHCPPGTLCNTNPQAVCEDGGTTTFSGVVKAGVSTWLQSVGVTTTQDPVPNVLVYIPNNVAAVAAVGQGYTANACPACSADVTGNPLVSTYTAFDGTFTLSNVPTGTAANGNAIPLIIQMGRWRRQFSVDIPTACSPNGSTTTVFNLPENPTQGNIPLTAISTGTADQLECVLLKMGIDEAEFTSDTGGGRIHIYGGGAKGTTDAGVTGAGNPGSTVAGSDPEATLMQTAAKLSGYDQVMLPCWGDAMSKPLAELENLGGYANSGGHFFATHFSYSWLNTNPSFAGVATWDLGANPNETGVDGVNGNPFTGNVSTLVPPDPPAPNPGVFEKWLNLVGALSSTNPPQVMLTGARHDVDSPATAEAVDWIDGTDPAPKAGSSNKMLLHFTFNTPVAARADGGAAGTCGHAIFSDFHVTGPNGMLQLSNGTVFPAECAKAAMTPQEKILEYMIWDLGACVGPPPPPVCNPLTCAEQNLACGQAGDGCGNAIPGGCGTCPAGDVCSSGQCVPPTCNAIACPANIECGPWANGCGGTQSCGTCPPGTTCGGGGVNGMCGAPDAGACVPQACPADIQCGPYGDGCGNIQSCGTCPPGTTCGGGGVNGMCGAIDGGACVPQGCPANIQCGPWGDGCGNIIPCGTCTAAQTCGGGGVNGMCGGGCVPLTCPELGFNCGLAGDGCGNTINCGPCPAGQTCGGGGVASVCGEPTTPK